MRSGSTRSVAIVAVEASNPGRFPGWKASGGERIDQTDARRSDRKPVGQGLESPAEWVAV